MKLLEVKRESSKFKFPSVPSEMVGRIICRAEGSEYSRDVRVVRNMKGKIA